MCDKCDRLTRENRELREELAEVYAVRRTATVKVENRADAYTRVGRVLEKVPTLTLAEANGLSVIVDADGSVASKEAIRSAFSGGKTTTMKLVDVRMCNVRKKIRAAGHGDIVATVFGTGYRLTDAGRAVFA